MPRSYSVKLEGLEEAAKVPGWLEFAQRDMLDRAVVRIAEAIGQAAPGGLGGRVGRTWQGRTLSSTKGLVSSGHPAAKALARGAYITPKRGRALRFESGDVRRFARLPTTNYDRKGLRKRRRIVEEEFARAFSDLRGA